ncbi:PREDICTED: sin3 histone deacetylase corepressor complex component SDS3-like [Branchiostoma belcheri]|uniref:Sin3 histone deacetylase corepressor complex component SDS3-like n=1 Tax=Branchiostoma belcheri TaxID=7741 RepID=A0A6P4ZV95_BRABE|nr:PREDICTED: sin3 histone deacetylase corepressor complex component SDS3-like [Branchiostoma belcheri]
MAASLPHYGEDSRSFHDGFSDDSSTIDGDEDREFDNESDEDTEDASETDQVKREEQHTEMKEQVYKEKLAHLKKQLEELNQHASHPEYLKRLKRLENQHKERSWMAEIIQQFEIETVEKQYIKEKKDAVREFDEEKIKLKESLIQELEERKRMIESERNTMELTGDSTEVKPVLTRKLRRRPNEPLPIPDKRRKPSPVGAPQLNLLLSDDDVLEDLRIVNKGKLSSKKSIHISPPVSPPSPPINSYDARIEEGRLFYDKKWYHRGQTVYVESKDNGKISGTISSVGQNEVWVRRLSDNSKFRVYVSQLQKGKYSIRKRAT